jgi:hypothetical protein
MAPARVVGTMNAAEFIVAVSASAGFIVGLGWAAINLEVLLPLLIGGVLAAPIAAWVAHRLPMRIMGVAVGGMIIFTNSITLTSAFEVPTPTRIAIIVGVVVLWLGSVVAVTVQHRRSVATGQGAHDYIRQ